MGNGRKMQLIELAREIEARRTGVHVMNGDEDTAVNAGLQEAQRGEFVPDDEMDAFWTKLGLL
jgi:predicted transcriptional regulator